MPRNTKNQRNDGSLTGEQEKGAHRRNHMRDHHTKGKITTRAATTETTVGATIEETTTRMTRRLSAISVGKRIASSIGEPPVDALDVEK